MLILSRRMLYSTAKMDHLTLCIPYLTLEIGWAVNKVWTNWVTCSYLYRIKDPKVGTSRTQFDKNNIAHMSKPSVRDGKKLNQLNPNLTKLKLNFNHD